MVARIPVIKEIHPVSCYRTNGTMSRQKTGTRVEQRSHFHNGHKNTSPPTVNKVHTSFSSHHERIYIYIYIKEVFTTAEIHIVAFWVIKQRRLVGGHERVVPI